MASVSPEPVEMVAFTSNAPTKTAKEDVSLKRELGLFSAVNLIVGVMIGSGIFISPTAALYHSGSVALCLIIWTLSGLVSLLGALCFAELGTVVPKSGAEYAYFQESFGKLHPFWGPLPAFICSWVYIVILRPAEVAVVILTFSEYLIQPFGPLIGFDLIDALYQDWLKKIIAILTIALITYINFVSVKLYLKVQNIFSSFKVLACIVVIGGGIYELAIGNVRNLGQGFTGSKFSAGSLALAFYNGLWAFDGWSTVTIVTEEIINPSVNIPRSIMIAVPLITALYVFMNVAYMTVLTVPEMISVPAVALAFGEKALGPLGFIVPLGVVMATFGCALSVQFGVTRLCYVAGREGHMIESFSYIHTRRSTPAPAVIFQGFLAVLFVVSGDIGILIEFASFLLWFFYGGAMVSLIVLRRTKADLPRPYKVPIVIPWFVLLVAILLSVVPIVCDPNPAKYLIAVAFIASGLIFYIPFVYYKRTPACMKHLTFFIQVLYEVVPPSSTHVD